VSRIAYVNGRYQPLLTAAVHVEDRGFQFADGVYEVVYVRGGRLIDRDLHMDRLDRSLAELDIAAPMPRAALLAIMAEVARQNRLRDGLLYVQITRGTAPRNQVFPRPSVRPTLVVTMRRVPPFPRDPENWAAAAITHPDQRWARCDIKSVSLLPNVLAREAAKRAGALEAILIDKDGMVTEGAATSAWIVDAKGTLITRPLSPAILPGCTRAALIALLPGSNIAFEERAFSAAELRAAREIFITAATTFVRPIVKLDGVAVGDGKPGQVTRLLFQQMAAHVTG
jgi:D-alanine transaminase